MKLGLSQEQAIFLERNSIKITEGEEYFYMPHWYKKIGENMYEILSFDQIPEYVKSHIENNRKPPSRNK